MDASTVSKLRHDLRTPINHILGYSELLEEDLHDQGIKEVTDLDKIRSAARELLHLIDTSINEETLALAAEHALPSQHHLAMPASMAEAAVESDGKAAVTGRILVVDDNTENRSVLVRRLQRQGHETAKADHGAHALEMLAEGGFDLVLLDVIMPVMDGYTALVKMKSDEDLRHIPVIMISALDEIESVVRGIEAGAEDYLPKPFNPTLLRARIGASLEKKRFRDQEQTYLRQIEETQERLENELQEAARYVASILPPPMDEPYRIRWEYDPSTELGGDSFGYHWIDDDHFAIYLLDVCGHGVGAALLSVAAINVIRSSSLPKVDFRDPAQVLQGLNDAFQMERHNGMYFTIWYGVFHRKTRALRHASGGHPPSVLLVPQPDGSDKLEKLRCPGVLIGALPDMTFKSDTTTVPPGARLCVFCDGAYEIRQPNQSMIDFDDDFIPYIAAHGREDSLPTTLLSWVRSIRGQQTLDDDYSFLIIDLP